MGRLTAAAVVVLCVAAGLGSPASGAGGKQKWIVTTSPGQPTRVAAVGTVNAFGTVTDVLTLFPNGTFDNLATQEFPKGNLLYHGAGTYTFTLDPRSCVGKGDVVGPFEITGGTGAYAGATGSGVALIDLTLVFTRTPTGCSQQPAKVYGVAKATGTLDIP